MTYAHRKDIYDADTHMMEHPNWIYDFAHTLFNKSQETAMIKNLIPIFVLIFTVSCVAPQPRMSTNDVMNSWIGSSESSLINSWGIPTRSYFSGNQKFIEYTYSSTSYQTRTNDGIRNNPYLCNEYFCPPRTATTSQVTYWCTYTITVENSKITFARWNGNNCPN